jgi:hypothetical protein
MKVHILLIIILFSIRLKAQNKEVIFQKGSWDDILQLAKKEHKLIFVDLSAVWCAPCKWMEKNVFANDTVAMFYNKTFINYKIDTEKGEGPKLAKQWAVIGLPSLLYINENGEIVHRACGCEQNGGSSQKFIMDGQMCMDSAKRFSFSADKIKYEAGKMTKTEIIEYINKMGDACVERKKELRSYYLSLSEKEFSNASNQDLIMETVKDPTSIEFNYFINNYPLFVERYGKSKVESKITDAYKYYALKLISKKDTIAYFAIKNKILLTENINTEKLVWYLDIHYFLSTEDNVDFINLAFKYIEKYRDENIDFTYELIYNIYDITDDIENLNKAKSYAIHIADNYEEESYSVLCASIMLKLKMKDDGIKYANHAVDLIKKNKGDLKEINGILNKLKGL